MLMTFLWLHFSFWEMITFPNHVGCKGLIDLCHCFCFYVYDKKKLCTLHSKHPTKHHAPTPKCSSINQLPFTALTRSHCMLAMNGEVFLKICSPSASFRCPYCSLQRSLASSAWAHEVLEGRGVRRAGKLMSVKLRVAVPSLGSLSGSSHSSVLLHPTAQRCQFWARQFRGGHMITTNDVLIVTEMLFMLSFTFTLLIYVSLGQKKVIILQNGTFFLKHPIKKKKEGSIFQSCHYLLDKRNDEPQKRGFWLKLSRAKQPRELHTEGLIIPSHRYKLEMTLLKLMK